MERLASRVVYENSWLRLAEDTVVQGGARRAYTVVHRPDSVVVVPLSERRELLLVLQDRHPTGERSWELPGGSLDEGETADAAARRELAEETGLDAADLVQVGTLRPLPGLTAQRVTTFVAPQPSTALARAAVVPVDDIVGLQVATLEEALRMVRHGTITDGLTVGTLLHVLAWIDGWSS